MRDGRSRPIFLPVLLRNMPAEFYHDTVLVLTDAMFFEYVPNVIYTGTATQRNAAYLWAEQGFVDYAGCPIFATTVTGTYLWPRNSLVQPLEFSRVQTIDAVTVITKTDCNCTLNRDDGCGIIIDSGFGFVDLRVVESAFYSACGRVTMPYQMEVAYTTGFATGTIANDTSLHMALSMMAEIFLNEILDPASNEGGPGNPGIKSYSNLSYSEQRQPLFDTSWGMTARTNMAARMVKHLKKPKKPLKIPSRR